MQTIKKFGETQQTVLCSDHHIQYTAKVPRGLSLLAQRAETTAAENERPAPALPRSSGSEPHIH